MFLKFIVQRKSVSIKCCVFKTKKPECRVFFANYERTLSAYFQFAQIDLARDALV